MHALQHYSKIDLKGTLEKKEIKVQLVWMGQKVLKVINGRKGDTGPRGDTGDRGPRG